MLAAYPVISFYDIMGIVRGSKAPGPRMAGTYIRLDSPVCLGDYMKLERDNERCYADRLVVNEHSNSFQQHCVRAPCQAGHHGDHKLLDARIPDVTFGMSQSEVSLRSGESGTDSILHPRRNVHVTAGCYRGSLRRSREPDLGLFLAMTGEGYSQRKRRVIWRTSRGPGIFSASYEVAR